MQEKMLKYICTVTANCDLRKLPDELTAAGLAKKFNVSRNTASHYMNQALGRELIKINTRPVYFLAREVFEKQYYPLHKTVYSGMEELLSEQPLDGNVKDNVFEQMIGYDGSLSKAIEQIVTSVLYPNNSLPILLHGPTGTGKSYMASMIYQFAVDSGILKSGAPYITVNCAQYANNPELLSSSLFGYVKGAFTGAYANTKGMLENAHGGVLFLDEVHRLNSENQEKLFVFMDQGRCRRMGENDTWHKASVRIVMATTCDIQSQFLATFLRRIPVLVPIPALDRRAQKEKRQFIYRFFIEESKILNREIQVSSRILDVLEAHVYSGNVGELKNIIKYLCATTYAQNMNKQEVILSFRSLPESILNDLKKRGESKVKKDHRITITPETKLGQFDKSESGENPGEWGIFSRIYEYYRRLLNGRITVDSFEHHCFDEIKTMLDSLIFEKSTEHDGALLKYITSSIQDAFRFVEYDYNTQLNGVSLRAVSTYFYFRNNSQFKIKNKERDSLLQFILDSYKFETQMSEQMLEMIASKIDIVPQKEDRIFLTLYLRSHNLRQAEQKIKAIILAHGYATASSIANTVNTLLKVKLFDAFDIPVNSEMGEITERVRHYVQMYDTSKGILLLVDMGSLQKVDVLLQHYVNSPMAIINNVSTQMAIQAGALLKQNRQLEEIVEELKGAELTEYKIIYPAKREYALLTCCFTGIGTAEKIKEVLEESIPKEIAVKVLPCDYESLKQFGEQDPSFCRYQVLGIIGNADPGIDIVTYLSLEDLMSGQADEKIAKILGTVADTGQLEQINDNLIRNFSLKRLINQLTILDINKILCQVEKCLKIYESSAGIKLSNRSRFGVFFHVSCLIERLIRQCPIDTYENLEEFKQCHKEAVEMIQKSFSGLEQTYSVKMPLSEIGYLYDILQKNNG